MRTQILAVAVACLILSAANAAQAAEPFWAQATFIKGEISFVPAGEDEAGSLERGQVLHQGDTVAVPEGARASFLLNDGGILVLKSSTETVLGPKVEAGEPSLKTVASNLSKTLLSREGDNPMLKHLGGLRGGYRNAALAPCRTKVLGDGVRLIWMKNTGTKKYIVTLMGPGDDLKEKTITETYWDVSSADLAPGEMYYWEVRDAASPDSFSTLGSGSFTVLEDKAGQEVRGLLSGIRTAFSGSTPVEDSTPLFLSYQIYREKGLNLDALVTLREMIGYDPADETLRRWQREICKEMGLPEELVPVLMEMKSETGS